VQAPRGAKIVPATVVKNVETKYPTRSLGGELPLAQRRLGEPIDAPFQLTFGFKVLH
jgi:hypothetical protein